MKEGFQSTFTQMDRINAAELAQRQAREAEEATLKLPVQFINEREQQTAYAVDRITRWDTSELHQLEATKQIIEENQRQQKIWEAREKVLKREYAE